MGNVITINATGFDQGKYNFNGPAWTTHVVFKLDGSLEEATFSHGPIEKGPFWKSVTLNRNGHSEESVSVLRGTQIRLDKIKLSGSNEITAASGTTSGSIEVSGSGDP